MRSYAIIVLALLVGLSGCASLVSTDLDRSANFSQYKTFGWLPAEVKVKNPVYDSKLIDRNIKYAVEQEFAKRGIARNQAQPDLLVKYHTFTEKKKQQYSNYNPYPFYGYGWGIMPYRWAWGWPYYGGWGGGFNNRNYTYTAGTLVLDVIDNRTNELIWRGSIEGDVDNVNRMQKQVDKAVQAIMKKYPIKPGNAPDEVYAQRPFAS
jgi:hypothetical protein